MRQSVSEGLYWTHREQAGAFGKHRREKGPVHEELAMPTPHP